jgi:hypothetical protein
MISSNLDIGEFLEVASKQDYSDVILLADQEATETERLYYRKRYQDLGVKEQKLLSYAQDLKDLIRFIRYGLVAKDIDKETAEAFNKFCCAISENGRDRPRCDSKFM